MSHICFTYHIIWRTKYRQPTIEEAHERELYSYIYGMCKNMNCYLHRINSMPDHVHMCVEIHQTISVSNFVQVIKQETSKWIKEHRDWFPYFLSWGKRFAAFSYSKADRPTIIEYIKNQKTHHKTMTLDEEIRILFRENDMEDEVDEFFVDD